MCKYCAFNVRNIQLGAVVFIFTIVKILFVYLLTNMAFFLGRKSIKEKQIIHLFLSMLVALNNNIISIYSSLHSQLDNLIIVMKFCLPSSIFNVIYETEVK